MAYTYDADGNMISEIGKIGTDKVETYYDYAVENRLAAVYEADELLVAMVYDGDGNRVFQLNYNLHTDEDWKANSGNGNGSNKDNSGSSNSSFDSSSTNSSSNGSGNTTNAEENTSQNQSGILFPADSEVSDTEQGLIDLIKTTGKQKNYELIEYINDVNREYAEVLVEQNINGKTDTSYVYGVDRLSLDRFDESTGYYLYDPRGSVTGITNEEGQLYQSYRYGAYGEITFGAPQYENEYTYNGESYNPNIESQYLRARYYYVVTATFLTEDSYLGNIIEPLTLNRYVYCVASPLNYKDPSGYSVVTDIMLDVVSNPDIPDVDKGTVINQRVNYYNALQTMGVKNITSDYINGYDYVSNERYVKSIIISAVVMQAIIICGNEILKGSYGNSTKDFLISVEGIWRTVVKSGDTYSIGYGMDFTQSSHPELYRKYVVNGESITDIDAYNLLDPSINAKIQTFIDALDAFTVENSLLFNQNQYDALFSFFYNNGAYVFSDDAYISWVEKGGEYQVRAEARQDLKDYLIAKNGSYDNDKILELFLASKGPSIKYEYVSRRTGEANLFVNS